MAAAVIHHHGGKRTVLHGLDWDRARVRAFARAIEERAVSTGAGDRAVDYGRDELTVGEWRRRLEARTQHADYRSSPAMTDGALAVLRNPHATSEQRVGAALAARLAGIPPERIRVAAQATADERMRVALEAVADDAPDEAIEKAVKRLAR